MCSICIVVGLQIFCTAVNKISVLRSSGKVPDLFVRLYRQSFIKVSNIKFHANLSSESRVDASGQTDRQTDGHDEGNRRFSRLT
jgi:hypothetical protein